MNHKIFLEEKEIFRILVVDDDQAILQLLERLLFPRYMVVCVSAGIEAVKLLRNHQFNLILANQKMPGITGVELLKLAAEIQPQAVGIILTGYADADEAEKAIKKGIAYKHIVKPWNDKNLRLILRQAIEYYEAKKRNYDFEEEGI